MEKNGNWAFRSKPCLAKKHFSKFLEWVKRRNGFGVVGFFCLFVFNVCYFGSPLSVKREGNVLL